MSGTKTGWTQAGVDYANSDGVYGKNIGLTDKLAKMSLKDTLSGWQIPTPTTTTTNTNTTNTKLQVDGGKGKRSNSRKKIRKNRRATKTRRYKK